MGLGKLFNNLKSSALSPTSSVSDISSVTNSKPNHIIDKYHTDKLNKVVPYDCPVKLSLKVESPPIVLFGPAEQCSGAIFSGLLYLEILGSASNEFQQDTLPNLQTANDSLSPSLSPMKSVSTLSPAQLKENYVELKTVSLALIQVIKYGKPFMAVNTTIQGCVDCATKVTELASWDVMQRPTAFAKGSAHGYPFSYLVPGSLPATTNLSNVETSIRYELTVKAIYVNAKGKEDYINMALPIIIRRSILRGQDRNSIRAFPPTEVTASAVIPNVAYPKATLPVEIRINNVSTNERRWRMRKLTWRVEESTRVRTQACEKHQAKFSSTVESIKKANKGKKVQKNSGGVGAPVINFFYEPPARREPVVIPENDANANENNYGDDGINLNESGGNLTRTQNNSNLTLTNPTNNRSNNLDELLSDHAPPALSSFASNWSHNALNSPISNIANQPSLAPQASTAESTLSMSNSLNAVPLPSELYVEEIKTLSTGEMKSGWKSDFSNSGRIEIVVEVSTMGLQTCGLNTTLNNISLINTRNCNHPLFNDTSFSDANISCDIVDHESGVFVSHNLVIEVVVAEEMMRPSYMGAVKAPSHTASASSVHNMLYNNPGGSSNGNNSNAESRPPASHTTNNQEPPITEGDGTGPDIVNGNHTDPLNQMTGVPTGVARVLRMQFKLIMTERSGLGVAWDDEVPPIYPAVSALSPPTYDEATSEANTPAIAPCISAVPLSDISEILASEVPLLSPSTAHLHSPVNNGSNNSLSSASRMSSPPRVSSPLSSSVRSPNTANPVSIDSQMNDLSI